MHVQIFSNSIHLERSREAKKVNEIREKKGLQFVFDPSNSLFASLFVCAARAFSVSAAPFFLALRRAIVSFGPLFVDRRSSK